jgi:hypothetical protein
LTFKGISWCMPSGGVLSLICSIPSNTLPYPFTSYLPIFQHLSIHILISLASCGMRYYWCSTIFFSFPSFPEFHRVVPLLQTCPTTEFVFDNACFCVYVYLWIHLPPMRENMHLLCFWFWLTSLKMMSSNCIHLPSNPISLFLVAE